MCDRVYSSGSYGEALCIIGDYVNITGDDDLDEDMDDSMEFGGIQMEIAMLIAGFLLGGCISTVILCCVQINRINSYEQTIQSLLEKLNK